ncbi:YlxR family protein [Candidatus Peregrinibacteria bacterium]|nr:YlxR family protein [Candidatus Peregrinibacteria bacterium]
MNRNVVGFAARGAPFRPCAPQATSNKEDRTGSCSNRREETDRKNSQTKHVPLRTCASCRKKNEKSTFLRIVRSKNGNIAISPNQEGRSVYLCKNSQCIKNALHRKGVNAISYSLKVPIAENFENILLRRC